MIIRFMFLGILLAAGNTTHAAERFLLKFDLTRNGKTIYSGNNYVTPKTHTWSRGLQRSYLKLRCHKPEPGYVQKLYSTEDHFAGLRLTHRLVGGNIEITAIHTDVRPRLIEIRALSKKECKDLSPVVTSVSETYHFPAKDGVIESRPFGDKMFLKIMISTIGDKR